MSTIFIPHRDMSADQVIQCSYAAMAIINLCDAAAFDLSENGENAQLAGSVSRGLKLAGELLGVIHETLESHEGLLSEAISREATGTASITANGQRGQA